MSDTETIIKALRILAREIESGDGVANAAIAEAAGRLEEQQGRIKRLESIIHKAKVRFCQDGSDEAAAAGMLKILDEAKDAKP